MPWDIVFYKSADGAVPTDGFLDGCPVKVRAQFMAVLDAVAEGPPPQFSGGGRWEAMHGEMGGWYEIRTQGPKREQFRLFCILENAEPEELKRRGLPGPAIAVITGMRKPWMTTFDAGDYARVRSLGNDYVTTAPRRIAP
ncbi:MAG: hypothetical protein ACRD0Q_10895 [Acidimicrobiales bacterium]